MTNFLITNVKIEKSPSLELEELVYMCIYTAGQEGQDTEVRPSLTFQLRKFWQRLEDADAEGGGAPPDRAELVQKIQYTPLNLGFESDAFVQRLDFLRDSFTFAAEQMDVFLKTLKKVMAVDEDEQDEQDEQEAEGGEPMEEHV